MAGERCGRCGNIILEWANGACQVCMRIAYDNDRYAASSYGRPRPKRNLVEAANGTWQHGHLSIVLDFEKGVYIQQTEEGVRSYSLQLLSAQGNSLRLKIGSALVQAHVAGDGTLILQRRQKMKFACWMEQEFKLCPQCFYRTPAIQPHCEDCGYVWCISAE
jgi:predicted amidophosphoribosyltransferase